MSRVSQERLLQREQWISADSSALAITEERVFWAVQSDAGSAIYSADLEGADTRLLARVEDGLVERLVVTPERVFAAVLGSASPRAISVPLDGGPASTIAELPCHELEFDNEKLYCSFGDALYELHPSGQAPQLLLEVPHVSAGAVADGAWYTLLEWQPSRGGAALAKRTSAGEDTSLLTCFQTSPTALVVAGHDIYWLSAEADGEAHSLRRLAR